MTSERYQKVLSRARTFSVGFHLHPLVCRQMPRAGRGTQGVPTHFLAYSSHHTGVGG